MGKIIPLNEGPLPSLCKVYGHDPHATKKQGQYRCQQCRKTGYCPKCILTLPVNAKVMYCKQHKPEADSEEAQAHE